MFGDVDLGRLRAAFLRGACPPPSPASNLIDGIQSQTLGIQRPADPEAPRRKR